MHKHALRVAAISLALLVPAAAHANFCFKEAAERYGVPEEVLYAIAKTESNFRPDAFNKNSNGTHDIGVMQINSGWLQDLAAYGIGERELRNPCTNIQVGAWILSQNAQKLGWNWNAIGAYNVGCKKLSKAECDAKRNSYAWKIHTVLRRLDERGAGANQLKMATAIQSPASEPMARQIMVVRLDMPSQPAGTLNALTLNESKETSETAKDDDQD